MLFQSHEKQIKSQPVHTYRACMANGVSDSGIVAKSGSFVKAVACIEHAAPYMQLN